MGNTETAAVIVGLGVGVSLIVILSILFSSSTVDIDHDFIGKNRDRVVFSATMNRSAHQIYLVNLDGSDLVNLTNDNNHWHFSPASSPDGSKIAYLSLDSFPNRPRVGTFTENLFVMNADGTDKTILATNQDRNTSLLSTTYSWAPDSRRIAFGLFEDIFIVNADGTQTTRLTSDSKPFDHGVRIANYGPIWSGDDSIIFVSYVLNGSSAQSGSFKEVNIHDLQVKQLFEFDPTNTGAYTWANDRRIVALVKIDGDSPSLYVMDSKGQNERLLFRAGDVGFYSIRDFTWSPDDTEIAFVASLTGDPGGGNIYLFDLNKGSIKPLPDTQTFGSSPVWSKDGRNLVFTGTVGDSEEQKMAIYVINADEQHKQEIARIFASIVDQAID